jgi:hypothetical protein
VLRALAPVAIERVTTQVAFDAYSCRPDLVLKLKDGRHVACEHKLDAPETTAVVPETGAMRRQLERYLELPVDAVAYFRPALVEVSEDIVEHPRYLRPAGRTHFLWRDLYLPLARGEHVVTQWLFQGFGRLGFTPAVPHIGELWPEREEVIENQRNLGKLWDSTREYARGRWWVSTDSRHGLTLYPGESAVCKRVQVAPAGPTRSLLRFRCEALPGHEARVLEILRGRSAELPAAPEITPETLPNGHPYVDLTVSLHSLLSETRTAEAQEARLYAQVVPLLKAVAEAPAA